MAKVIKKKGEIVEAYELGKGSTKEKELICQGKIIYRGNGVYEVFSQESNNGEGQFAVSGDYIKIDSAGFPSPKTKEWFLENHKHIKGNKYEQLPKELLAWEYGEKLTKEMKFLIKERGLYLNYENDNEFFGAELWGAYLTAPKDAIVIFYNVKYDEKGNVIDIEYNFVAKAEFEEAYEYIK